MKALRIVIDARMIYESGIGRYIRNLINQLQIIDEKNEYFILLKKDNFQKIDFEKNFTKVLADYSWYGIGEQVKLPKLINSLNPDLVHFPHFNAPVFYKGNFIVTIHDLIHQHFSMQRSTTRSPLIYKVKQFGYKKVFNHATKYSDEILVPSFYVKNQLINECKINADKITVTYEAVDDKLFSQISPIFEKSLQPYIFYVGNAHPHKNVEGLIKAFLRIKENHNDLRLILAGSDHYFWQRIKREFQSEGIIYKGYVSDEELMDLYKKAKVFVMPSFEEGFGIPLLEAFAASCPVASSNAGSLPEIGGDACIYFNPNDLDDMVNKISMVLEDEKLRQQLVQKGTKRYKQFSWKKLAQKTLEVYRKCA